MLKSLLNLAVVCISLGCGTARAADGSMQVDLVQHLHWKDHHFAMTNWFYKYKWSETAVPTAYGFCQGDRTAVFTSSISRLLTRLKNSSP
jgi:hypothetical protein